jgi:hypothetical protein
MVQSAPPAALRPLLYLDSGAAASAFEKDPNVRDGFHHTRSMFRALMRHGYTAGVDLHRLTFTGQTHDAAAWAARVAIPLQLLFPPPVHTQVPTLVLAPGEDAGSRSAPVGPVQEEAREQAAA